MEYVGNKVKGINIAYIGGGSRGWAWHLMSDLALEENLSGVVRLYDIDYEAARKNEIIGNRLSGRNDAKGKWEYKAVKTLQDVLQGADFVIISILPGTFKEMYSDVHTPEKYGVYQSVGDTVGPGGIVRALRTIPMYADIADNIKKYSPDAWVINYTNPMTICTRTLYEVFPEIKAFGCCHEVFESQKLLAYMLKEMKGIEGVTREEIRTNVLGINHFVWIDSAAYKGTDIMPLFEKFADKHYEEGLENYKKTSWKDDVFTSAFRMKFDLFKRYGVIPAQGDRHTAEFLPNLWYLKDPETVKLWKFSLTPVNWRIKDMEQKVEKSKRLVSGEEEFVLGESGEEGVRQIKAILGLGDLITNVNLPNQGQVKGLPIGSVVETNALFSRNSVRPVFAGQLPYDVQSLVIRQVYNQETTLKAGLCRDKKTAFRAFSNDPLLTAVKVTDAKELFDEMLENTKDYLPGWNL